jgi:hypothetical protein
MKPVPRLTENRKWNVREKDAPMLICVICLNNHGLPSGYETLVRRREKTDDTGEIRGKNCVF